MSGSELLQRGYHLRKALLVLVPLVIAGSENTHAADRLPLTTQVRANLPIQQIAVKADWAAYRKTATTAAASAIAIWQSQVVFKDVKVNGVTATGGTWVGPTLKAFMESEMINAGVPAAVASGFAAPVSSAWSSWCAELKVAGLAWYPSFACFAGPLAPPTPNVPTPLASLSGNTVWLTAPLLKESIAKALGTQATSPEATAAIDGFASDFAARFTKYRASAMVTKVMGTGPVPHFAPPAVPCGPVVNGTALMAPGGMVGTW